MLFAFLCTIYYEITIFLMSWNSHKQTEKIGYFSVILGWNSFFQVCLLLVFIEFLLLCTHVPCFICVHWSLCLKYNGIFLWLCFLTYWFSLKTNHAQKNQVQRLHRKNDDKIHQKNQCYIYKLDITFCIRNQKMPGFYQHYQFSGSLREKKLIRAYTL